MVKDHFSGKKILTVGQVIPGPPLFPGVTSANTEFIVKSVKDKLIMVDILFFGVKVGSVTLTAGGFCYA